MSNPPPSLLSLSIDSAVVHFSRISDLSRLPPHILVDLFRKILRAGRLNEKILRLFIATGEEEILSLIKELNIQLDAPRDSRTVQCRLKLFETGQKLTKLYCEIWIMAQSSITADDVDIVVGALQPDLTSFMNEWSSVFSRFHVIIVKDPDLKEDLKIAEGFDVNIYTKIDMDKFVGASSATRFFSGYSCRYFGYLISNKKYIISIDDDCIPAKDDKGFSVDAVAQHMINLGTPATPYFFNTLYDPYRKGSDFVRGYPFSMRTGVDCALSCGLWLNLADFDAPTQALKPTNKNFRYVDAVLTIPTKVKMPVSGINIGFNRQLLGPAIFPGIRLSEEGKYRWETVEDIWCGMCVKAVCDHLGLGVKSGLPYVWRNERGDHVASLKKEWVGMKLMEEVLPFFESLKLSSEAVTPEECVLEIAVSVKEKLGRTNTLFVQAADAVMEWVKLWKKVRSSSPST